MTGEIPVILGTATEAISAPGLFASQVTACKLRDERTIDVLTDAFGLDDD